MHFEFEEKEERLVKIKVVGVGGGGGNALNTMISGGLAHVDFVAANTDAQALKCNKAQLHLQLGRETTKGLGAGANPDIGAASAEEDVERIKEALGDTDMVFVTCGMGGGTGTGAAPVIARVAREMGALAVGVVTRPFIFEGARRARQAESGIQRLKEQVDALIVIPNMKVLAMAGKTMQMTEAFRKADDVLYHAVKAISDIITVNGLINVDFADVRTIMASMGRALMGTGAASGERRAVEAAQKAVSSPLLEDVSIHGAKGVLINVTGPADLTLDEVNDAATFIQSAADPEANIIFGSVIDEALEDEVRITVIATGFEQALADQQVRRPERLGFPMPAVRAQAPVLASGEVSDPTLSSASLSASAPSNPSASTFTFSSSTSGKRQVAVGERRPAAGLAPEASNLSRQWDTSASDPFRRPAGKVAEQLGISAESEIDIPTFLRKRVDIGDQY
ncbi:MAG: cell division protein FtsZ [Bdellovibrionota bacterium]